MPQQFALINAKIVIPERIIDPGYVVINGSKITAVGAGELTDTGLPSIDLRQLIITPGFIDLHLHGGGGFDTMDGTIQAFHEIARLHAAGGTTAILPTTLTSSQPELLKVLEAYQRSIGLPSPGAKILGLHLEGPYLAQTQAGAHNQKYLRNPVPYEYEEILTFAGLIKRISIAPELPGSLELGRRAKQKGIIVSAAHTEATFEQVETALGAGFSLITHLYSAMSTVKRVNAYRIAGTIEAGLLFDDMTVEVIADGKHLPASLLKLIYKCKGPDKIILCTDAVRATGLNDGEYIFGSQTEAQKMIVSDGVAWMPDRKAFAGSIATANHLIRVMVEEAGVPLADAIKMLTTNPARLLNREHDLGRIEPGKSADLVVLDHHYNVKLTMVDGCIVFNDLELEEGVRKYRNSESES